MNLSRGVTLIAATIAMGLVAGLFYAYACSVMIGLGRSSDRTFVEAMQRINVAILNGWFAASFGGAVVLTALAAALHLLYAAALVITFAVSVPLNDQLAAAGEPDRIADLAAVRERFEARWVAWNVARMLTSTAAFGCLTWALVLHGRATAGGG